MPDSERSLFFPAVVVFSVAKNFKPDDTRLKTLGLGNNPNTDTNQVEIFIYPPENPPRAVMK